MKVVIIGTGNAAFVLGKKIQKGGDEIIQVVGRNIEQANALGSALHCEVVYSTRYIKLYADIFLIIVADQAIPLIASQLKLKDKIVAHVSAAVSKEVVAAASANYGVVYPLQSLRKEALHLPEVPVLIDANNGATRNQLIDFSSHWAEHVEMAEDEERLKIHTAAVFSNNFINHLLTLTEQFCHNEHLNFKTLLPLLNETIKRLEYKSPADLQTGPAIRKDITTIKKHQEMLTEYPELQKFYNLFTNSILNRISETATPALPTKQGREQALVSQ